MIAARTAETIPSLDVFLNNVRVGTIVRTPGDFNAFSLDPAFRATGGYPVLSLSLRAASGRRLAKKGGNAPATGRGSWRRPAVAARNDKLRTGQPPVAR